tara:strand:- start:170 stop:364 length:195 start_codon:yes stop_codon:yes gene_type:complete
MKKLTPTDIEMLAYHLNLNLNQEELQTLALCFSDYSDQLRSLHKLDLENEEVGFSFDFPHARRE